MLVLGIESSCDETGLALYCSRRGLLAHNIYSQVKLHKDFGGVVPELASRDHARKLLPLLEKLFAEAEVACGDLEGIAYTAGPGLMGALLVGASFAKSLAWSLDIPAIGVHHMEGHLLAPMLESNPPAFPFVALLVSGGHTQLVAVEGVGRYQTLGESVDDAAGEAFDKTAKLLDLDYPGGPNLAALAETGDALKFRFPRPMTDRPGLDFSFSGLKTFARNLIAAERGTAPLPSRPVMADIAAGFELAVAETLAIKCRRALVQTGMRRLVIAGGVSANKTLREVLSAALTKVDGELFYARQEFCTDNGAMIAYAGWRRLAAASFDVAANNHLDLAVEVRPRWPLDELPSIQESA